MLGIGLQAAIGKVALAFSVDGALVSAGIAAAIGSGTFAGYMSTQDRAGSHVSGGQNLHVFSQPGTFSPTTLTGRFSGKPSSAASKPGVENGSPADLYVILEASRGTAMVDSPTGPRKIVLGGVLPDAGRVLAIQPRGGRWVIVTENGVIRSKDM